MRPFPVGCAWCLGLTLFVASLAAAPVPVRQDRPGRTLAEEVWLPPLGLFDPARDQVARPEIGRTDPGRYASRPGSKKLREAVREAQATLWALSNAPVPRGLQKRADELRKDPAGSASWPVAVRVPRTPAQEAELKEEVLKGSKQLARAVAQLEAAAEKLEEVQGERSRECPRWQATYDLTLGWAYARLAALEEQAVMLGVLRKDPPAGGPAVHSTLRLVPRERVGDPASKRHHQKAVKLLQAVVEAHPGTVWANVALQGLAAPLGAEWQATK